MVILALEASTSAVKAMLGEGSETDFYTFNYPQDVADGRTIDPDRALALLLDCGHKLLRREGKTPDAIALSSVWHGLLPVDADVRPLGCYHTWADTSAASALDKRRSDETLMDTVYRRTGCPPHSSFTFWKLMDLKDRGDLPPGAVTLGEYLFYRLTGERRQSVTSAAGTGLLNIDSRTWDADQLSLCGMAESGLFALAEPESHAPLVGEAARLLGVPPGIPVMVAMPDGALNQIAAGGMRDGLLTLSVGTSGALRLSFAEPRLSPGRETWCYYGAEGRYIAGGAVSGAGNLMQWFLEHYTPDSCTTSELESLLRHRSFERAPFFLPFLYGERSPGWRDHPPHGFRGEQPIHDMSDRAYALLEGMLMNLYQNYGTLTGFTGGLELTGHLSGGILGSPFWCRMAADLFGLPFTLDPGHHASVLGAVQVARKAMGELGSFGDIPEVLGMTQQPDPVRHEQLMVRYARYLDYYGGR